ncbi:unnamed protein product [Boreogadus saida]
MQNNTRGGRVAAVGDEPMIKEDRRIPGNQSAAVPPALSRYNPLSGSQQDRVHRSEACQTGNLQALWVAGTPY